MNNPNNSNEALNGLNQLLDIYPNDPCLLKIRTEKYRELCRHNEALTDFCKAFKCLNIFLDTHPNDKVVLWFQGEVMIDILTELLKMNPNNEEEILHIRAQAYTKIGKYDEVLVDLNRLLEINPNNKEILSIRAQAYTVISKNDKALVDLTRLLEINPYNKKALKCFILMNNDEESSYHKFKKYFDGKL